MNYENAFKEKHGGMYSLVDFCKIFPVGTKVRYKSTRGRKRQETIYLPVEKDEYFVVTKLDKNLQQVILWNPKTSHIINKSFKEIIYFQHKWV